MAQLVTKNKPNRFGFSPINLNINTGNRGMIRIKSGWLFSVQGLSFHFYKVYETNTSIQPAPISAGNSTGRSPLSLTLYNSEFTSQATLGKGSGDQTARKAVLLQMNSHAGPQYWCVCNIHGCVCTCLMLLHLWWSCGIGTCVYTV